MTVRETIDFSARCQGVGSRAGKFSCSFNPRLSADLLLIQYQLALIHVLSWTLKILHSFELELIYIIAKFNAGMNTRAYRVFPLETILRIKCIENNKRQLLRNIEGNNIFRFSQQSAHLWQQKTVPSLEDSPDE
jgi:hypothetical protein